MTHKKERTYFKDPKKITARVTFRLVRVGFWRSTNFKSRRFYASQFPKTLAYNSLLYDSAFNTRVVVRRWLAEANQVNLEPVGSASKLKDRCIFVGRGRATNQQMFMTRHTFRHFLKLGMLPGFVKYTKF